MLLILSIDTDKVTPTTLLEALPYEQASDLSGAFGRFSNQRACIKYVQQA